jgi:hypothetical protein
MKTSRLVLARLATLALSMTLMMGCRKFIEVEAPVTSSNSNNVYTTDATAVSALTGIYANFSNLAMQYENPSLTTLYLNTGLAADELILFNLNNLNFLGYYRNSLSATSISYWNNFYAPIFAANAAIEGLTASNSLTASIKTQLLGEAKFVRALCYFNLVNLFGDVPLATTTDYKVNSLLARTPKNQLYQQIISDLLDAQSQLSANFLKADAISIYTAGTEQRVRPTKWASTALLARVYLYTNDYINAEASATAVINNTSLFSLPILANAFKMNSTETIWALQPVLASPNVNTGEGRLFILPAAGPNTFPNQVYLSNNVVSNFETGDQRKTSWVGSVTTTTAPITTYNYAFKYKAAAGSVPTSEYMIQFRLAEQYLIRAEARAHQNNIAGSQSDINALRTRAQLSSTTANTQPLLMAAIAKERISELFTEGHHWFDLKRTNVIDAVMTSITTQKGGTWSTYKALFPIPQAEISRNPNMIQNSGY